MPDLSSMTTDELDAYSVQLNQDRESARLVRKELADEQTRRALLPPETPERALPAFPENGEVV